MSEVDGLVFLDRCWTGLDSFNVSFVTVLPFKSVTIYHGLRLSMLGLY